ncbi:gluconokinase [Actinomadura alba]|uniref:Gluconokinase n=1 Tax=Actinomadura alba TaxID=406431 RepID=A0ABR7LKZ9_9ACTN|nr:gluconokinase [Actinomadura alba]MBC6465516.1 gluconokinase [Actinomadura alba]
MNTPTPSPDAAAPPLVVIMGVSGSGKTVVGGALAERLGVPFADADDFHSPANIAKMSAGTPLDDTDRLPWLRAIGAWLAGHAATGGVAGCSALKRAYRDVLRESAPQVTFLHLHGDPEVVRRRVAGRATHFMPASLVASQFQTLEPLQPDENGIVLDLGRPVGDLVDAFLAARSTQAPPPPASADPPPGTDSGTPAPPGE